MIAATPRVMLMLRLATEVGLRRCEVARVHTRDLLDGIDGAQLLVHGKGGKDRLLPIADDLAEQLALGAEGHTAGAQCEGWLFPGDDEGHLSPRWVGRLCGNAMPGVWTMHKLRHRFATKAYRGTRNLRAVQTLLGHASVATTERYTAVDDSELREAMLAASESTTSTAGRWVAFTAAVAMVLALLGFGPGSQAEAVVEYFTHDEAKVLAALTSSPHLDWQDGSRVELVAIVRTACAIHDAHAGLNEAGDAAAIAWLTAHPRIHHEAEWWALAERHCHRNGPQLIS